MKPIVFFPFNGNSIEALSVLQSINAVKPEWDFVGFVDDNPDKKDQGCGGYRVMGDRTFLQEREDVFVLAVPGSPVSFLSRPGIIRSLGIDRRRFVTLIHPSASIGIECMLGENTLLMNNVVLTADVKLGHHVVVLPNTILSHNTRVGSFTVIGSNTSVSGNVSIGENCYIGSRTSVINGVSIGDRSIVGIGSNVIRSIQPDGVFAGNPARKLR